MQSALTGLNSALPSEIESARVLGKLSLQDPDATAKTSGALVNAASRLSILLMQGHNVNA
eukprot:1326290-Amphidinium_carterae.2